MARFDAPTPVAVRSSRHRRGPARRLLRRPAGHLPVARRRRRVAEHIRRCWASLYTSRAIIYRLQEQHPQRGPLDGRRGAEDGQRAGLRRRHDHGPDQRRPLEDHHRLLLRGGRDGGVRPGHARTTSCWTRSRWRWSPRHLGDKHAELVPDAACRSLVEREVDAERRAVRCLTDAELTAVAQMAKRAEKHYGCPQDIEWALDRGSARRREPAAAAVPPRDRPLHQAGGHRRTADHLRRFSPRPWASPAPRPQHRSEPELLHATILSFPDRPTAEPD